ncbi:hypothetical protein HPB51_002556 [Rhipicephalus microplus]|uniref:Uncharacterized protein n=1 Tax=Rhipicephalus microplus TaxID=6941 RepID=A0A9J6DER1_RHIMP|nr:hypothetical protein HPB51_002556 [Rhipicephalus microplus]
MLFYRALHWLPVNETAFMALGATVKSIGGVGLSLYFTATYSLLFYKHQSSYIVPLVWMYPLPYFAVAGCMLLGILIAVALPLDSCEITCLRRGTCCGPLCETAVACA